MKKSALLSPIKNIVKHNYYTTKAYYVSQLYFSEFIRNLNTRNREKVIVYQMGKVGSSTIVNSLKALSNIDVYHVHVLTDGAIKKVENTYKKNFSRTHRIDEHLLQSQYLRKQLNKQLADKNKWKIVTLVREPIAKNISSFFNTLNLTTGYEYNQKLEYMSLEEVNEEVIKLFFEKFSRHEAAITWLDRQLKPVFDIDVFSKEFPKAQGYDIYESEFADLLLIRLENLNECAGEAFNKFLGINNFNLLEDNIGSKKDYRDLYRKFLDTIVLPDSYIEKMYTSKYARHFYSEEEIEAFKARWRRQNQSLKV